MLIGKVSLKIKAVRNITLEGICKEFIIRSTISTSEIKLPLLPPFLEQLKRSYRILSQNNRKRYVYSEYSFVNHFRLLNFFLDCSGTDPRKIGKTDNWVYHPNRPAIQHCRLGVISKALRISKLQGQNVWTECCQETYKRILRARARKHSQNVWGLYFVRL